MAGILFDITFTPGATAIGAFLEYRPLHPSGPSGLVQYAWITNLNTPGSNVIGYFPITSNPMVLDDVPGMFPDFQENSSYEFRIRQICADGTELYSPVDGTYMVPACDRFSSDIDLTIPPQQGPFGVSVSIGYRPFSSISSYTIFLRNFNNLIATHTVSWNQMDTTGNIPYTYVFTNSDLIPPAVFNGVGSYSVGIEITVQTSVGPYVVANCNTIALKAPNCASYNINVGDQWGLQWFDCLGGYHDCYSQQPYLDDGLQVPIQLCATGIPNAYYCDGQNFVNGSVTDPNTGNVLQGGEVTLVDGSSCLPGYDDYENGLLYRNGFPVTCIPNPTCGANNIIIVNTCLAPLDFDGTTFRNGDPIPYVDDPIAWNTTLGPAWCWVDNQVNSPFGKLYNWYALMDTRNIAPVGYHVPTSNEWSQSLITNVFNSGKTPNDFRSINSLYWDNNAGATDYFGIDARGSGRRTPAGLFEDKKTKKYYWYDGTGNPSGYWMYFIGTYPAAPFAYYGNIIQVLPNTFESHKRFAASVRLFCD